MKKLVAIVAFVAAMLVAGNAQAQLSVRFGYAPESITTSYNNYNHTDSFNGFFVGVHNNFNLKNGLQFSLGVQGRMNMHTEKETLLGVTVTTKNRQTLVDVPITLNYSIAFGQNVKITPFVGPMLTFALSGKTSVSGETNNSYNVDWYGKNPIYKRFNLAVLGGVNLKYVRLNLFGGYQMGLLNLNPEGEGKIKTGGMFFGLGYDL